MEREQLIDLICDSFGVAISYRELDEWVEAIKRIAKILEEEEKNEKASEGVH